MTISFQFLKKGGELSCAAGVFGPRHGRSFGKYFGLKSGLSSIFGKKNSGFFLAVFWDFRKFSKNLRFFCDFLAIFSRFLRVWKMVIFHAFFMVLAGLVWELGFGVKSGHFGTLGFIENNFWKNISARGAFPLVSSMLVCRLYMTTTKKKKKSHPLCPKSWKNWSSYLLASRDETRF